METYITFLLIAAVLGLFAEISGPPNARGESGLWSLAGSEHLGTQDISGHVLFGGKLSEHSEHLFISFLYLFVVFVFLLFSVMKTRPFHQ